MPELLANILAEHAYDPVSLCYDLVWFFLTTRLDADTDFTDSTEVCE
jgi:hypothetical protein